MLIICLMGHCNNNCKFCLVKQEMAKAEDIPLENIKSAVSILPKDVGVDFFGGEPTLYPFLKEALAYTKGMGHRCTIASNARKFSDLNYAKEIASIGIDQIRTSIYGDTAKLHDIHTQSIGSFTETILGIKNLLALGVDLYVNTVITSLNYQSLPAIIELVNSFGVRHMKFGTLIDGNNCLDFVPDLRLVRPKLDEAIRRCNEYGISLAIEKSPLCISPKYPNICLYEPDEKNYIKVPICQECLLSKECIGISKEQVELYGENIVVPFRHNNNHLRKGVNFPITSEEHRFLKWNDNLLPAMTILMKVASTCNLACDYCYASRNFNKGNKWINKDLVSILFEQLGVSSYGRIDFDLHGGEPLTWDISDFNNFFHKQNLLKQRSNKDIVSRIQVNGTLITSRMAKYLKEMNIEVGVSLDGPQVIHDIHRQFKAGNGSFSSTIQGIGILVENDCEFEILSVVTNELAQNVKSAFEFFSELVDTSNMLLKSINFLPSFEIDPDSRTLLSSSITPDQYVNFLIPFFDMWFENDSEDFHISLFEEIIAVLLGGKANTCNFRRGCNGFLTLEPDGSVYPCDRFSGIQEFRLGNLFEDSLPKILASDAYKKYNERVENYPEECLHCEWQKLCQGGCLYHAWALNPTINEPSYYCGGLKKIFQHIEDTLIENLDNYERYLRPETMN